MDKPLWPRNGGTRSEKEERMRVRRVVEDRGEQRFELPGEDGSPVPVVADFLRQLHARGYSPNTLSAYAHDLLHFFRFLAQQGQDHGVFTPADSLAFLEYLRAVPSRRPTHRLTPVLATVADAESATQLAPATVNRILAAVSSFYEYLVVAGKLASPANPIRRSVDHAAARVADRHRSFLDFATSHRPIRRAVRVKTAQRLPRPLGDAEVAKLLGSLRRRRDRAMVLLMLQGGLRPGEVLNLHLEDVQYGRRRVVVRHRTDHPKGVRTKSRVERVVDLHEPEALAELSAYVLHERPREAESPLVFLVGGRGARRLEPLGYQALVRLFARRCERLGIRAPWVTPHALRHTHATKMWEGGMRELTLQKRLGHASPESTRLYTRVSDAAMVEEYVRALVRDDQPGGGR
jgi:integrase